MKKENVLFFTNKNNALNYLLPNLKSKFARVVLPSVIGENENKIFANYFTELDYYGYRGYLPDYDQISDLINNDSLLYLKDLYDCNKEEEKKLTGKAGLVIKDNYYIIDKYIKNDYYNVIQIGEVNFFYREPLGVYVNSKNNLKPYGYAELSRTKYSFLFHFGVSLYNILRHNNGLLDLIDEHIELIEKSNTPRLPQFIERKILNTDLHTVSDDFRNMWKRLSEGIENPHFKVLFCEKHIYLSLILYVRDKSDLMNYLAENGIKSLEYLHNDLPLNEEGKIFNDSLIFISLAYFLRDDKKIDRLIDILNRW